MKDSSKMSQTPHDDEVYFNIASMKVPSNEVGKVPEKAVGSKKAPLKKADIPIERLKIPAKVIDENVFFDVGAGVPSTGKALKPEKNVSLPKFFCAPEDSCDPAEINDDTHEIDMKRFEVIITDSFKKAALSDPIKIIENETKSAQPNHAADTFGKLASVHDEIAIEITDSKANDSKNKPRLQPEQKGGKNDYKPWVLHRKMPVKAVFFSGHSPEKDVIRNNQNSNDLEDPLTAVTDTSDSQVFLGKGIFEGRDLDSEGIQRGNQINKSDTINAAQNASGAARGAKDARSIDKKEIPLERAAVESIQRAMNKNQFLSPESKNHGQQQPSPPHRLSDTPLPDIRSEIRDRVDKAYSALSSSVNLNPQASSQKPTLEIETAVFKASVIETSADPNYVIFSLQGRFDQDQKQFEGFLEQIMALRFQRLICNMSGLLSMSSSGWGILIAQLQRLKKHGGNICLCGMNGEVEQCFRVLELDKLFSFYRSISEAISALMQETQKKPWKASDSLDIAALPLEEKIKRIITENPFFSIGRIHKRLKTEEYGKVKINGWSLQAKLRSLGLGTKEERYRFFRSA